MPERETRSTLVASTVHVTEANSKILDSSKFWRCTSMDQVWSIYLGDVSDLANETAGLGLSVAFFRVCMVAKAEGHDTLLLDADGMEYDDLPKFDW